MKISIEEIDAAVEEEIIIRCHQVDQEILELCRKIKKNLQTSGPGNSLF